MEDRAHEPEPLPRHADDRAPDQRKDDLWRVVVVARDDRADRLERRVRPNQPLEERRLARHDPIQRAARDVRGLRELVHRQLGQARRHEHLLRGGKDSLSRRRPRFQGDALEERGARTEVAVERRPRDAGPIRNDRHRRARVLGEDLARRRHHLAPDGRVRGERWHAREPRCDSLSRQVSRCRELRTWASPPTAQG